MIFRWFHVSSRENHVRRGKNFTWALVILREITWVFSISPAPVVLIKTVFIVLHMFEKNRRSWFLRWFRKISKKFQPRIFFLNFLVKQGFLWSIKVIWFWKFKTHCTKDHSKIRTWGCPSYYIDLRRTEFLSHLQLKHLLLKSDETLKVASSLIDNENFPNKV